MLAELGERVFCLSRGYGGSLGGPKLVAEGDRAAQVGDEPLMLARVAPTVVARDRVAGARLAREHGASVIVMDDGLQNASLAKDFTIAVVDGKRGIGNARVFPAGPLRAPLAAQLAASDALLVVGEESGAADVVAAAQGARAAGAARTPCAGRRYSRRVARAPGVRLRRHRPPGEVFCNRRRGRHRGQAAPGLSRSPPL